MELMIEKERKHETIEYMDNDTKINWLMDNYGQQVIALAYTYVKQKEVAEDIAQEVFIKCYERLDTFRNESSYKTWIYRITINKCKDVLRSWSFKHLIFTDFIFYKKDNPKNSPELKSIEKEENELLSESVMSLPIKLREVIILFYYEDLSIEEISNLIECNENTIKTRLHRARIQLRKTHNGGDWDGR